MYKIGRGTCIDTSTLNINFYHINDKQSRSISVYSMNQNNIIINIYLIQFHKSNKKFKCLVVKVEVFSY